MQRHTGRVEYAFDDLPLPDETSGYVEEDLPCKEWRHHWTRWLRVDSSLCTGSYQTIGSTTEAVFADLLQPAYDHPLNPSPTLKDVQRLYYHVCDEIDELKLDLGLVSSHGACWKHVNRHYRNVYDVTYWFDNQGSITSWEDISQWLDAGTEATLSWPVGRSVQEFMDIFHNQQVLYPLLGKLDDVIEYEDLPETLRNDNVEDEYGVVASNPAGKGVVICGSLGEVANDPTLGSAFDMNSSGNTILDSETTRGELFQSQR